MRFASLGSGSKGNATLIEQGSSCIMIDCGFSTREVERRMDRLGKSPDQIDALIITHEHGDHIRGVGPLARKYKMPVYMTYGTHKQSDIGQVPIVKEFDCHDGFSIGDINVSPFPVPHDAREPCQFVIRNNGKDNANGESKKLGILTDTGSITPHIQEQLSDCDALLLECNHEPDLLWAGEYPPSLKQRVAGDLGHLSNAQAISLLQSIVTSNLKYLAAAHLSEKYNSPERVRAMLSEALDCDPEWINIIDQELGMDWCQL